MPSHIEPEIQVLAMVSATIVHLFTILELLFDHLARCGLGQDHVQTSVGLFVARGKLAAAMICDCGPDERCDHNWLWLWLWL